MHNVGPSTLSQLALALERGAARNEARADPFAAVLCERLAQTRASLRMAEALWVRLEAEEVAVLRGWSEELAAHIDDEVAVAEGFAAALAECGIAVPEQCSVTAAEQRCLDVVLDPGASLFRALHAGLVGRVPDVEQWGVLAAKCAEGARFGLAERCLAAQEVAHDHLAEVRGWLRALEDARQHVR